jgi:hypothetical protein
MAHAPARADIEIGRGTLANWIIRPAELHYSRLYEALRRRLLSQPLIHGDETTVHVLKEPGKTAQNTAYMWVYRTQSRRLPGTGRTVRLPARARAGISSCVPRRLRRPVDDRWICRLARARWTDTLRLSGPRPLCLR